jgi:hypothetical protein
MVPCYLISGRWFSESFTSVCKTLNTLDGDPEEVNCFRNGSLLVYVSNHDQAYRLQEQKVFAGGSVEITPHNTLNTCKNIFN